MTLFFFDILIIIFFWVCIYTAGFTWFIFFCTFICYFSDLVKLTSNDKLKYEECGINMIALFVFVVLGSFLSTKGKKKECYIITIVIRRHLWALEGCYRVRKIKNDSWWSDLTISAVAGIGKEKIRPITNLMMIEKKEIDLMVLEIVFLLFLIIWLYFTFQVDFSDIQAVYIPYLVFTRYGLVLFYYY
jgi:hypothetical protein